MKRKSGLLVGTMVALLVIATATRSASGGERSSAAMSSRLAQIGNFAIKYPEYTERQLLQSVDTVTGWLKAARQSVGSTAASGIGVGVVVGVTNYDGSIVVPGRRIVTSVESSGEDCNVDAHFVYRDVSEFLGDPQSSLLKYVWYNANDGTSGSCNIPEFGFGTEGMIDLSPVNRVVIGGNEDDDLNGDIDLWAHVYYQPSIRFACPVDDGALGSSGWAGGTSRSRYPTVAVQWTGTDIVYHAVWSESEFIQLPPGPDYADNDTYHPIYYARKINSGQWGNVQTIDTIPNWSYELAVLDWGNDVAVSYTNTSPSGRILDNPRDMDVYVRRSLDRGLTWQPKQNITGYQNNIQGHPNHFTAWVETDAIYDSYGNLHVLWNAFPTSEDPYWDGYLWTDFSCNLYHWNSSTDYIAEIASADYGLEANFLACGFGGYNAGYIANFSISECDDKLFVVFGQLHSKFFEYGGIDYPEMTLSDCAYQGERFGRANWEIFVSVAENLEGFCWDKPRDLSDTYTPDCGLENDPMAEGPCGNEYRPSMSKYAYTYPTAQSLIWPPASIIDPSPTGSPYTGDSWLDLIYYDDEYPGAWYHGLGPATVNDVKWLHMACVEPIMAPEIAVSPSKILWPEWVMCGTLEQFPITVTNDGNVFLSVYQINSREFSGSHSGWLATSVYSLEVQACNPNTATFDVLINASGYTTPEWLEGEVELVSDDPNRPSVTIPIRVLAACAVEPVRWDTVATSDGWGGSLAAGDNVALTGSNHGSVGHSGLGGVNMDFTVDGGDCDPLANVYLYDASPFVMIGTDNLTTSHWTDGYEKPYVFKPQPWSNAMEHGTNAEWDSVYLGQMVNRDSLVAIERTLYAPRGGLADPSFVVLKMEVYSFDGSSHSNVTLGSVADWDIPSTERAVNNALILPTQSTVAVQGTGISSCQDNSSRYGMEVFLGWYTDEEYALDPTVNHTDFYGSFATGVDPLLYEQVSPLTPEPSSSAWWNEVAANVGLNISPDELPGDIAVFTTYAHNVTLPATGRFTYYTAFVSVHDENTSKAASNAPETDLDALIQSIRTWYAQHIRAACFEPCQTPLLHADFDQDVINAPPDPTLPGDPVGDQLEIGSSALVRDAIWSFSQKPLEIVGPGLVVAVPSSTAPRDVTKVQWRSACGGPYNIISIYYDRSRPSYTLAEVEFMEGGELEFCGWPLLGLGYTPYVEQCFEVTIDFKTGFRYLDIDGVPRAVFQSIPDASPLVAVSFFAANGNSLVVDDIEICELPSGCCDGRVGNANGQGDFPDEISLGDIMLMVDVLFISNDCTKIPCPDEADVNQSGGPNPVPEACLDYLSLADIMTLVDFLFITGPQTAVLPDCL